MSSLRELAADPRVMVRRRGDPDPTGRCVVYWMQRAQRGVDNPALNVAIRAGNELGLPVAVFFGLHPGYPGSNLRHYAFLAEGIPETARRVRARGAAFVLRVWPDHDLLKLCEQVRPALVVGDENPLREPARWRDRAARRLRVPFWTVDADVVVPSALFPREEYAARTLRPRIGRVLDEHLVPPGNPRARVAWSPRARPASIDVRKLEKDPRALLRGLPIGSGASPVADLRGGTAEAGRRLRAFVARKLSRYHLDRNRPELRGTSELSAYLHFGHIGPHTVALAVQRARAPRPAKEAFLEELIVRRELAVNFVARNPRYDRLEGCHEWARKTLRERAGDPRPYLYTESQLENALTHDPLWNAAQTEMATSGRMHGYMRMYWAKKILEWTADPEEAFGIAVRLNDRYEMDGRDPNGYTGVAWAIGAKHDRPWGPRRPIFGLVRVMTHAGMKRKIDIDAYVERVGRGPGAGRRGAP